MNERIDIPPHGFVRIIDAMGNDESVVRAARVSYAASAKTGVDKEKDARLIHRLWRDKHVSPFESVTFTFEIMAPIFVWRQFMRHRVFSYNELSGRYRELPATYYLPRPEDAGVQSKDNKQGRTLTDIDRQADIDLIDAHCRKAFELYRDLLSRDWPRELARMVLPLNVYSHAFVTGNLRNFFHFFDLRLDSHAQMEIRVHSTRYSWLFLISS
jgi:thymidylate synthase (FAD)